MSSHRLCHGNCGTVNGINYGLVNKCLHKAWKTVQSRDLEDILFIDYKGYQLNVLPFICHATHYYSRDFKARLLGVASDKFEPGCNLGLSDLKNNSLVDPCVLKALFAPSQDHGMRWLALYMWHKYPSDVIQLFYSGASGIFKDVILEEQRPHITFKDRGICNTQAFSFYICALWLLHLVPELRIYLGRQIKSSGLQNLLDTLCPEESIHFKYISGKLTSVQLEKQYTYAPVDKDKPAIYQREVWCCLTEGEYDGGILTKGQRELASSWYDMVSRDIDYNLTILVNASISMGKEQYSRLKLERDRYKSKFESASERLSQVTSRADRYKDECSSVREELSTLKSENSSLRAKLGQIQTDEELKCKLKECQCKLESSEVDLDELLTENLELKRVIRQEKKEIKRLQSRLVACSPVNESLVEDSAETAEVPSLDIIVQGLMNYNILLVGGEKCGLLQGLEDYGLRQVRQFDNSIKSLTKVDYIVIVTQFVSHQDVNRSASLSRGTSAETIYYNGTNTVKLLYLLYNEILG